jgi:uncharacterized protein involved in exopolysaccharide biosynthesis
MVDGNRRDIRSDEIDLIELGNAIWSKRFLILKITALCIVFGLVIAFTSKVEYIATAKLMPESEKESNSNLGGLSGLAGLAGINLNTGGSGSLTPALYPEIIKSSGFIDVMINTPVYFENSDTTITGFEYFKYVDRPSLVGIVLAYTIGLPSKIKGAISSDNEAVLDSYDLVRFSKEDWSIMERYSNRLTVSVDAQTGIIKIETEMPDPVAAAKTASLLVKGLTDKIVKYKVGKGERNLQFIEDRFQEAKESYEENQSILALFTDRNRNISNSIIQTEYERLKNQLNISFEVYKGLATQLEKARIQVKEETPVFTVLEPVKIPVDKSTPNRKLIVLLSIMLGLFLGIIISVFNYLLSQK